MTQWLSQNIFTILIVAVLIAFFGWLTYTLIRDRKQGKSSCCGGCAGCAMAGQCHRQTAAANEADHAASKRTPKATEAKNR